MEQLSSLATIKSRHSRPNKPSQTLGMSTSMSPSSIFEVQSIKRHEIIVVTTTSFIRHHIEMDIHGIMYHVSKQLFTGVFGK